MTAATMLLISLASLPPQAPPVRQCCPPQAPPAKGYRSVMAERSKYRFSRVVNGELLVTNYWPAPDQSVEVSFPTDAKTRWFVGGKRVSQSEFLEKATDLYVAWVEVTERRHSYGWLDAVNLLDPPTLPPIRRTHRGTLTPRAFTPPTPAFVAPPFMAPPPVFMHQPRPFMPGAMPFMPAPFGMGGCPGGVCR
jgi:hypothetical protein